MRKRMAAVPAVALALGVFGATAAQASGYSASPTPSGSMSAKSSTAMPGMSGMPGMKMQRTMPQKSYKSMSRSSAIARARQKPLFFAAKLLGKNEVKAPGKVVDDPDGSAVGLIRLQGNQVTFAFSWKNISAPTLGHIHQGKVGTNGGVAVPLFGGEKDSAGKPIVMPDTATAAAGEVTAPSVQIANELRTDPTDFYLNLHTADRPDGAVRGQLRPLHSTADILKLATHPGLRAFLSGDQEVPGDAGKVGDPDARAVAFINPHGTSVDYSFAWVGVSPTLGHIHKGKFGTNGGVAVPLFTQAVPSSIFAMAGTKTGVDPQTVKDIRKDPSGFYTNLHSTEFPGGAARGQLTGR